MTRLPDPAVRERWSRLFELYEQSKLSIANFCNLHGVSTASFYQWRRKVRSQSNSGEFLSVQVNEADAPLRGITVRFPGGSLIEIAAGDTASLQIVVDRLTTPLVRSAP